MDVGRTRARFPSASRVRLRAWQPSDLEPFAALGVDPEVMRWLGGPIDRHASDAIAGRIAREMAELGFGLWAVEVPGVAEFIGFVGLQVPGFTADFTPCVEVGWRLAREWWGRGYASEAACASIDHGLDVLGLGEIVAFTSVHNLRSRRVMERVGMVRDREFDHPSVPPGHELQRHVLYRIGRPAPGT